MHIVNVLKIFWKSFAGREVCLQEISRPANDFQEIFQPNFVSQLTDLFFWAERRLHVKERKIELLIECRGWLNDYVV